MVLPVAVASKVTVPELLVKVLLFDQLPATVNAAVFDELKIPLVLIETFPATSKMASLVLLSRVRVFVLLPMSVKLPLNVKVAEAGVVIVRFVVVEKLYSSTLPP